MAKQQGIDDIIKAGAKLLGKATKATRKGAKKVEKKVAKEMRPIAKKAGKKPPVRPKAIGKPPAVGSKISSTRGGMNTKELDAYLKKTHANSSNYYENSKAAFKEQAARRAKNKPKPRGSYK